jgi:hypothetical protein
MVPLEAAPFVRGTLQNEMYLGSFLFLSYLELTTTRDLSHLCFDVDDEKSLELSLIPTQSFGISDSSSAH